VRTDIDIDTEQIEAQLKELIITELNLEDFTPADMDSDDILFGEKFGLDSIDAVEVVYLVEKHFGVAMKDMSEARPALTSVRTLAAFIKERQTQ
jgi:acyl carrier protein